MDTTTAYGTWAEATAEGLKGLWQGFLAFIPDLVGAIIVFVLGWIVAVALGKLIAEILTKARFNQIFERGVWKTAFEKAELKVKASDFIGAIVKWALVLVFLSVSIEILGLKSFAGSLNGVLGYLPNVIVAAFLFVVTVIVVDIVEKVVRTTIEGMKIGYGNFVSAIVKWSIWTFVGLAILTQLGVAPYFMQTLFAGIVAMLVISFGLAFGLGGRDVAEDLLKDLRDKLKK